MPQVVSANRLTDGTVVYLDPQGKWVEHLADAAEFASDGAVELGLAKAAEAVAANLIVDPFAVPVVDEADGRRATTLRNAIRALGPTVVFQTSPAAVARR
jgi:hypothetical protein